ncbi:MAG: sodium:calcium symporter [Deferribacterota bacterium]|nr:sodium:calcium symporter [Deferribacterota bacterium]
MKNSNREVWSTRIGVILAMSATSIGLGNFVRFPAQIAKSEVGGSFMIPYFISLLILGIPILWVEWTIGRYGGKRGQGTHPFIFQKIWKNRYSKYLGIFGLSIPILIASYYTYIVSWNLGYAFFSLFGSYINVDKITFLQQFIGADKNTFNIGLGSLFFYIITLFIIYTILSKGLNKGIEKFNNIFIPLLLVIGVVLTIRVLLLGPDIVKGLSFIWEPNFEHLFNWQIWIIAAGQIFFTLSIGQEISVYASYLREDDDIAIGPLTQTSINEFSEVIIGGCIAIPVIFFFTHGLDKNITEGYNISFIAIPMVLEEMSLGRLFGVLWFTLLFIAGITTILASCFSFITFLKDNFSYDNKKAAKITLLIVFFLSLPPTLWYSKGVFDEVDFWVGALFLVIISIIEVIMFAWIMGINKAWEELNKGAKLRIPNAFKYVVKYITPLFLIVMLIAWCVTDAPYFISQANIYIWIERILILSTFIFAGILIYYASDKK